MARSRLRVVIALVAGTSASGAVADQKRPPYLPGGQSSLTARPATSYQLRREKDGWVHDAGGFIGRIADDGTVRFDDKRGTIGLALPLPLPLPAGTETLEGALRKLNPRNRQRQPEPPPPAQPGPIPRMSPYLAAPHDWCAYPHPCHFTARVLLINASGTFDVTDEIMRLARKDPYRNQKAAFLASTAQFRQDLGQRAATRARTRALDELRRRLDGIDADRGLTEEQRRAALQALAAELDPDPAVAGPARALIEERLRGRRDAGAR